MAEQGRDNRPLTEAEAARRLRQSIALALQSPGDDGIAALDRLVEQLVKGASEGNLPALKELLDRFAGKTNTSPSDEKTPNQIVISWKQHTPSMSSSTIGRDSSS